MSNVTISIAGRSYRLACADGEEEHLQRLGAEIDGKLMQVPGLSGQSEPHSLLYAALLMADALDDARKSSTPAPAPALSENLAGPLEKLAERLESLAARLEGSAATS